MFPGAMKSRASAVADFYEQLAFLVRSNFPLPECLRRMEQAPSAAAEQAFMEEIRRRVGNGEKLSDVLASHPERFDELHVRLIRVSEATDSLADVLYAVARESRFEQFLVGKAREIMTYPLFVFSMAMGLLLATSIFFMPVFEDAYSDMSLCRPVPVLIVVCLKITHAIRAAWPILAVLIILGLASAAWLFSGTIRAHRSVMWVLDHIPGSRGIARVLDSARICSMCRLFLERRLPLPEALRTAALVVQLPQVKSAVERTALRCEQGAILRDAVADEKDIPSLIVHTISFEPEDRLAEALGRLQEHYEQEVLAGSRDAAMAWTLIGLIAMTVAALFMVVTVFMPVVNAYQVLQYVI